MAALTEPRSVAAAKTAVFMIATGGEEEEGRQGGRAVSLSKRWE